MPMHDALIVSAIVVAFAIFGTTLFVLEWTERKNLRRTRVPREAVPTANDDKARRAA